jgi:hypothetical protein
MLRMDAWAMKKSWSNFCSWAYEIKVSRQDFLKDDKWHAYLQYCNEFYFVCPPEIIQSSELPPEVGLLWTSKNAKMLYTKKKAPRRTVDLPIELFIYILMCRTKIVPSTLYYKEENDRSEYWRAWLEKKKEDQGIGHAASKRLQKLFNEHVTKVRDENSRLQDQIEDLQAVKDFCTELGYENVNHYTARKIKDFVSQALKKVPDEILWTIDRSIDELTRLKLILTGEKKVKVA